MPPKYSLTDHTDTSLPIISIIGPTASGKSKIAIELARHMPIEIISLDSAQIYTDMDIGTAKPDQYIQQQIPHHLINLFNPTTHYSAAQFCEDAQKAAEQITQRGNIPVLVGGTMMYFKALTEGLSALPQANSKLRIKIDELAKENGWPAMHHKLETLDPISAARIKKNDSQRIQRALEICHLTKKPMSTILQQPRISAPIFENMINVALIPSDRSILHQKIAQRFDQMLGQGLVDEVRMIRKKFDVDANMPSMRCVGYRQVYQYLDNKIDVREMHATSLAATRQLAKRQLTWLRSMHKNNNIQTFDCLATNILEKILTFLEENHATKI